MYSMYVSGAFKIHLPGKWVPKDEGDRGQEDYLQLNSFTEC